MDSRILKTTAVTVRILALAVLILTMPRGALAQGAPKANALIIGNSDQIKSVALFVKTIVAEDGRVDHVFPPNAAIGYIPQEKIDKLRGQMTALRIEQASVQPAEVAEFGGAGEVAARVWNAAFKKTASPAPSRKPGRVPKEPPNDARIAPDRIVPQRQSRAEAAPASAAPGFLETSEYLIGSVTVGIITPESNGAIDPNSENWSAARQNTVVAKIVEGLQWWKDNSNAPANLSFVYDIHHSVPTSYEPIKRSSADEDLWISQVMTNLGYVGSSSQYFTQVRNYLNDKRSQLGTDWAFAIFIADSNNDNNGSFQDGSFAYTYLNGPFMVLTYDNDGWGIDDSEIVVAHEHGHMWGALDEYASSGCTTSERSGYLNIANTNCEAEVANPAPSIMGNASVQEFQAFPNHLVSQPARQMVGWRDSDGDGKQLYDPVDTTPIITLTHFSPDPTTNATPTYNGSAQDIPFPSPTGADITINKISSVQWRVDGGPWQSATASDGAFDSDVENFTFTSASLTPGGHTFNVRAVNSVGNISALASDNLTVLAVLPTVTITATTSMAAEANFTSGVFTVSRTGNTAQPLTVNYSISGTASGPSDYQSLPGTLTIPTGASSATITVTPIDDILPEGNESVIATLTSNSSYIIGAQNSAEVTIIDNDLVNPSAHVDCAVNSLQATLDLAPPGSTIFAAGACNENLLVRNELQRLTLDGGGTATINGPSTSSPAVNVRGKGILIRNFTITGGSSGIEVNRGSSAVIDNNLIHNTSGNGVVVDESAFAVLTNNTIQSNPGAGVFVSENSTARIGFNSDSDVVASPNTIQTNGAGGIIVSNGSSARIVGNTITGNAGDGVFVSRDSQSDLANNTINSNAANGIHVSEHSALNLGEDTGSTIYDLPNSGGSNLGFGVRCAAGGVAVGSLGTLSGAGGAKDFSDPSCTDSLN